MHLDCWLGLLRSCPTFKSKPHARHNCNRNNLRWPLVIQDPGAYEDWRHWRYPHLLEVLQQFPSCQPDVALLASQLSPLQPRFYSISSSPRAHPGAIHITVAVVSYKAQGIILTTWAVTPSGATILTRNRLSCKLSWRAPAGDSVKAVIILRRCDLKGQQVPLNAL